MLYHFTESKAGIVVSETGRKYGQAIAKIKHRLAFTDKKRPQPPGPVINQKQRRGEEQTETREDNLVSEYGCPQCV